MVFQWKCVKKFTVPSATYIYHCCAVFHAGYEGTIASEACPEVTHMVCIVFSTLETPVIVHGQEIYRDIGCSYIQEICLILR